MNVEHILARKGREVKTIRPDVSIAEALRPGRSDERLVSLWPGLALAG
jgi:hypothetical protein